MSCRGLEQFHVLRPACQPVWVELRSAHLPVDPFDSWAWNLQGVRLPKGWGKMASLGGTQVSSTLQRSIIHQGSSCGRGWALVGMPSLPPWYSQWLP